MKKNAKSHHGRKPGRKSTDGIVFGMGHPSKHKDIEIDPDDESEAWRVAGKGGGRDKVFATPEVLWKTYIAYSKWNDANPFYESKLTQADGYPTIVKVPKMRVKTLMAFCEYCGIASSYFRAFKSDIRKDKENFLTIINAIEESLMVQSFSGAASGFFNASIIARHLGLVEKQDVTSGGVPIQPPTVNIMKGAAPNLAGDEKDVDK